ncbi:hypothetical protein [Piscinibacter terrae]|uniref:hypothetical protein n=1 Tax=Piscinibacter terrae TaxID=2496871 RepID=UPI000F58F6B3|nr:hypothetical protein [Albitalea terrae]
MGHTVTGLVAKLEALELFARQRSLRSPVPLALGLGLLPLRVDDIDSILGPPLSSYPEGFNNLSQQLLLKLSDASAGCTLVYFETEYFGGIGSQGAAAFRDGALIFGPQAGEFGPINQALTLLGVHVAAPAQDEFETVGLHRYRRTEDWWASGLESAG